MFVINLDVPHCFLPLENCEDQPIVYNCIFMPEFLDSTLFTSIHFEDVTSSYLFKSLFPEDYMPYPDVKLQGTDFIEIGENNRLYKKNYNQDISLSDLAMRTFFSKNYFSKLFKDVTGLNVSDYIQKIRVDEACGLLKTTDKKVADIALRVGFNDIKFFYEVFKRITGKIPGEYRNL